MIPCGIPYIFSKVEQATKNILPDAGLKGLGVEIVIGEVTDVDAERKTAKTRSGGDIEFDKLILGSGSVPVVPGWLKGTALKNVFTIPKNKVYLDELQKSLEGLKKIVIVGAGFIGVEVADELNCKGYDVTLLEIMPRILGLAFDDEFAQAATEKLTARGVKVKTGVGIREILGGDKVTGAKLDSGETLEADAVILSLGYKPNSELAEKMGWSSTCSALSRRTSIKIVQGGYLAAGDCSVKRIFYGQAKPDHAGSAACAEARVAVLNLYSLSTVRPSEDVRYYANCVARRAYACGSQRKRRKKRGLRYRDRQLHTGRTHIRAPRLYQKQTVKLIGSKSNGVLLGGVIIGGGSVGELINVIGVAIQNNMTINDLLVCRSGPSLLTASPPVILIKAQR
jgi:NADPH-dependent 2,4-dienoyl-CoA reductase/sulfur reductase-like enzyme